MEKRNLQEQKREFREKIWKLLENKGVARFPLPLRDRIPNFEGSNRAAELLTTLPEWKNAKIVFSNPDFAQQKVRELALRESKILVMATPRLKQGYLKIDPQKVKGKETKTSTIAGAFQYGTKLSNLPKPDLVITGCVAVEKKGWRLGKGGGYGDREITRLIQQFGRIPVITTVHDLQIIDKIPHGDLDTKVNYIVTPRKVIKCKK